MGSVIFDCGFASSTQNTRILTVHNRSDEQGIPHCEQNSGPLCLFLIGLRSLVNASVSQRWHCLVCGECGTPCVASSLLAHIGYITCARLGEHDYGLNSRSDHKGSTPIVAT